MLLPDEFATKVQQLAGYAQAAGRDPGSITLTLRVPMLVRSPRAKAPGGDRPLFQGVASEVRADIERYAELGVSHFVFDPVVPDPKDVLQNMERFAGDVRGKVRSRSRAR
jgi:alkanesulfonate monooxygenase SsuD/methylene tetrahydromethanopterin reductase-like flavin-dependent oxidoreductase (luciferase family)